MVFFSIIVAPWSSGPGCSPKLNGAGQKLFGRHRFRRNQTGDQHPHRPPGRPRQPLHAPGRHRGHRRLAATAAGGSDCAAEEIHEPWGFRCLGGPFHRRCPHLALFKVGTSRRSMAVLRQEPAGAGVDFLTIQELIGHSNTKSALSILTQSTV